MNESVKEALANEEKTKRNALTKSDRKLLKSYFGFTRCHQIPTFPVRDKKSACDFIQKMLFDDNDEKEDAEKLKSAQRIDNDETRGGVGGGGEESDKSTKDTQNEKEDDEPFDLRTLLAQDVPTIFRWDVESLKRMFVEASRFTENQMIAVLRSFTAFDRLYPSDLAISTGFVRMLLIGPVSEKKERKKERK